MSSGATRSKVLPATVLDLLDVLPLRTADHEEMVAQGRDPFDALHDSYLASKPHVFTIFVDGKPAGIFGAGKGREEGLGVPWMLGNDTLLTIPRDLVREGRIWINYLNAIYPRLENYVDARNYVSIRWLKAMGFDFPGEYATLASGHIFRRFTRHV